jgi:hypothetical protein
MHTRRFMRLTNAFSKKVENHAHSVALFATISCVLREQHALAAARVAASSILY